MKFPGKEPRRASKKRREQGVNLDWSMVDNLKKKYGSKYTVIHTHPSGSGTPSTDDLVTFISNDKIKTSIIIPLNKKDQKPTGYFVMKKNRSKLTYDDKETLADSLNHYRQNLLSSESPQQDASNLKKLAGKYNFSYRFFPAEGTYLREEAQGFKSSRQSLETKLTVIAVTIVFGVVLVSLSKITGNVISEALYAKSNKINTWLLIIGICSTGLAVLLSKFQRPQ